eukprot:3046758-Rhodomonas_salina.3
MEVVCDVCCNVSHLSSSAVLLRPKVLPPSLTSCLLPRAGEAGFGLDKCKDMACFQNLNNAVNARYVSVLIPALYHS